MSVSFLYDIGDITRTLNKAKEIVTEAMVKEGFLDKEEASKFCEEYAVIAHEPGKFGSLWAKLRGEEKDSKGFFIRVMKDTRIDGLRGESDD